MPSWPSSLPKPLQESFSMQPEDRRIANSAVGTAFFKGFEGDVCIADCAVLLSPAQALAFEKFERDTLVQGTKWFTFPVWYSGEVHYELCRFKTRPKASSRHGLWMQYSFSLYVQKRSDMLAECLEKLFACWPPCFFFDFDRLLLETFSSLSNVTVARVNSALAEIYGE